MKSFADAFHSARVTFRMLLRSFGPQRAPNSIWDSPSSVPATTSGVHTGATSEWSVVPGRALSDVFGESLDDDALIPSVTRGKHTLVSSLGRARIERDVIEGTVRGEVL